MGVGGAVIAGYRRAIEDGLDVVVKVDGDGQMAPELIPALVTPILLGEADYTKGNRFFNPEDLQSMPLVRLLGNACLSFMTKMSSGYWHTFDSQCGFTAMRAHLLKMIDLDAVAQDYFFENDILIWLNTTNARVVDVPIKTLYGDEVSDVRISKVMWSFPPRLVRGWFFRVSRKYLLMDFGAIGALGLFGTALTAFGAIFGIYRLVVSNMTGVVTTTGTVMFAVLPVIVGIQCLLQAFVMEVAQSPGADETQRYIHELIDSGDVG
jgi:glycosyltransferase involved in cell wall biosynthesis